MSTVIFTGAGASRPLGYPTTIEFFNDPSFLKGELQNIYQEAKKFLSVKVLDVEDLLRLLEPVENFFITKHGKFMSKKIQSDWQLHIPNLIKEIREKCFDLYGKSPQITDVENLFLDFLNILNWDSTPVDFFTTNYDPVTDVISELADKQNISCYDGFGIRNKWNAGEYKTGNFMLRIYRLHGSMNWVEKDGNVIQTRDYSLRSNNATKHLIIYPGFKGTISEMSSDVLKFCHQEFTRKLNKAKRLVVIGFSFRDKELNSIFMESLKVNPALHFYLINPELPFGPDVGFSNIIKGFENRFTHLQYKFGDANLLKELNNIINK